MFEEVMIGDCRLILGDCREILPTLPKFDALVTDPPYGVMLGEIVNGQARAKNQQSYSTFSDTKEYIEDVVIPAIKIAILKTSRAIITPGNKNAWLYPHPDDFGVWYNPAGTGRGKWGFILAHMILFYGKDPRAGRNATASSAWGLNDSVGGIKNKLHPCPKPLKFTKWMVEKSSMEGEAVIDPFMGSGTTGIAAIQLGRKFTGIELERKYFDIACKRIEDAYRQGDMFSESKAEKPIQDALI